MARAEFAPTLSEFRPGKKPRVLGDDGECFPSHTVRFGEIHSILREQPANLRSGVEGREGNPDQGWPADAQLAPQRLAQPAFRDDAIGFTGMPDVHGSEVRPHRVRIADPMDDRHLPLVVHRM
jgi:hypothetical protein